MDRWPLTSPQENSVFLLRFQREWPFLQTKNSTRSENWLYWTAMTPLCRRSLVQSSNAALLLLGSLPSLQTCAAPMVLTGPLSLLSLILNINTKKKKKTNKRKKRFQFNQHKHKRWQIFVLVLVEEPYVPDGRCGLGQKMQDSECVCVPRESCL